MPDQTASAVLVAIKREAPDMFRAEAGADGASQLRINDSPGLILQRNPVESEERRADQLRYMGRLTGHMVDGSFNSEWSVGGAADMLLESITRGRWAAPRLVVVPAADDGTTEATNTIDRANNSFLDDGVREGDVISISIDAANAAHVNKRAIVTAVTDLKITVAGTPFIIDDNGRALTIDVLKKVITPTGPNAALTVDSYNVEQYDRDIDESELFLGNRIMQVQIGLQPNAIATIAWSFMGITRNKKEPADAPYFNAPDVTIGDALVADDMLVSYKGQEVTILTGLDLTLAIDSSTQGIIGTPFPSDVYMNRLNISGNVTSLRRNLDHLDDFDAETEFAIGAILREPRGDPRECVGIYLPRVKISGIDAPAIGGDGAKIETRQLMFGPFETGDPTVTGVEHGIAYFSSSAA